MSYAVELADSFMKEFRKLDKYTQLIIRGWITKHLEGCENPRASGKALSNNLAGLWRYRIGDYRLICEIDDGKLVVLALRIGHRRDVYA